VNCFAFLGSLLRVSQHIAFGKHQTAKFLASDPRSEQKTTEQGNLLKRNTMLVKQAQIYSDAKFCPSFPVITDSLERIVADVLILTKAREHKFHGPPIVSDKYGTPTA
jgi:hypothetical protein